MAYLLTAREPATALSWRWDLIGPHGKVIEDHEFSIDQADCRYQAFTGLYEWLRKNQGLDTGELLAEVGDWVASALLGRIAGALASAAPVDVLVSFPKAGGALAAAPFEIARVDGRSLGGRRVSFVTDLAGAQPSDNGQRPQDGADPLPVRILALFSLPDSQRRLDLRKARHELERLVDELSGAGYAIELRPLQYGTTRESLQEAVEDGDGWDVVHLLGHGAVGGFVLERLDGTPDKITTAELTDLLEPLRNRVRLVTVSSCRSGEADLDSTGSLAADLAVGLHCTAIGMRYPVPETFAAGFSDELYRLMFVKHVSLAQARVRAAFRGLAKPEQLTLPATASVLYGRSALDLRLPAPAIGKKLQLPYEAVKMAGFPSPPERFVGRTSVMSLASQALAPRSGKSGIIVLGDAGIGKTDLALELAHTHSLSFSTLIWHQVSPAASIQSALGDLAQQIDDKIDGLGLHAKLDQRAGFRAFLPVLAKLFGSERILLVIDGAAPLLSSTGTWRDGDMRLLVDALANEKGLSRLIITSRRLPVDIGSPGMVTLELAPLPRGEAALLIRDLPGLAELAAGQGPGLSETESYGLAENVLTLTRGYPEMLLRASQQADSPQHLVTWLLNVEEEWPLGRD